MKAFVLLRFQVKNKCRWQIFPSLLAKLWTNPTILKTLYYTSWNWRLRYKHSPRGKNMQWKIYASWCIVIRKNQSDNYSPAKPSKTDLVETADLKTAFSKWKSWNLHFHGLLSGSTLEVKETMARFTTDVIASCAFGINSNSLKDPGAEFGRRIKTVFKFSFTTGMAILTAFFAPFLKSLFRLKFVDDRTNNYIRQIVWNWVEYRWKKNLRILVNEIQYTGLCADRNYLFH